jgi:hypothetical protein
VSVSAPEEVLSPVPKKTTDPSEEKTPSPLQTSALTVGEVESDRANVRVPAVNPDEMLGMIRNASSSSGSSLAQGIDSGGYASRPEGTASPAEEAPEHGVTGSEQAQGTPAQKEEAQEGSTEESGASNSREESDMAATVAQLKQTERKVIAHEAAHKAVGGQYAGAISYSYTTGPDGKRYISGGEVPISTPSTDDPKEMLRIARQVMQAALAPADPSPQDRAVAASAAQKMAQAQSEIVRMEDESDSLEETDPDTNATQSAPSPDKGGMRPDVGASAQPERASVDNGVNEVAGSAKDGPISRASYVLGQRAVSAYSASIHADKKQDARRFRVAA